MSGRQSDNQGDMGSFESDVPSDVPEAAPPYFPPEPTDEPATAAAAVEPTVEAEEGPAPASEAGWRPQITEAPADAPVADPAAEADAPRGPLLPPGTTITVIYRGPADVADTRGPDGTGPDFRFPQGVPVDVPSEVAEELLTWPGEQFEVAPTEPIAPIEPKE